MQFRLGQTYSRREISNVLGGQLRHYLPFKASKVLCGCFRLDPEFNPGAPQEVLLGEGSVVQKSAELMSKQTEPIPVFLFREAGAWEFIGLYCCSGYSTDPELLARKKRENPARDTIAGVLYFESSS